MSASTHQAAGASSASIAAAQKMLDLAARGLVPSIIDIETAAWLVGLNGEAPPPLPEPAETHARLAAALAAGHGDEAAALLHDRLPRPGFDNLLIHACHLGGHAHADTLLDVAQAHPGTGFNGAMLAGTTRPLELLACLHVSCGLPLSMPDVVTIAELALRRLDGAPACPEAEAVWQPLWQPLLDAPDGWARRAPFRTAHLRWLARHDPASARATLLRYAADYGRADLFVGAAAVLARLAASDPAAAVALVASADNEAEVAAWLPALCWTFTLPDPARPLVARLLASPDPETALDLVTALARTPEPELLHAAWQGTASLPDRDERLARAIAPALMQLHAAGSAAQAAALRAHCGNWLGANRALDGRLAATELLDILGAPGLPPLVPWGKGPGLP